ncbi:hypothetical protein K503DRAFT_832939 [Rhizopogon vinicolor AM-OR11-026]|uniref:Uncharacterized protein n=1 Tax=Rhizopogon vinicolor AM-OR11-026 TaxID=1314800 RepID=A0A1B7MPQ6_9AGAM|nr:hypothetical protein K503DRAFT_832939 [Rhizopogon vinicolor AM-OR11-026]
MPKRKQFNIANLGSWAKSIAHSGGEGNVKKYLLSTRSLYFCEDAGLTAGLFKGMAITLCERGFVEESKLRAQYKNFKCVKGAINCCCRRVLYNQLDFIAVESNLESACKARRFSVLFLPKSY